MLQRLCLILQGADILAISHEVGLQDVAEHLDVITTGAVALGDEGVDVALALAEAIGQCHLWQELGIAFVELLRQRREQPIGVLHTARSHLCGIVQQHQGLRVVVNLHLVVVQAEAQRSLQTVGQLDVRLMEQGKGELRCMELLSHLQRGNLPGSKHRLHALRHVAQNGLGQSGTHILAEVDGCISAQPLVGAEEAAGVLPVYC